MKTTFQPTLTTTLKRPSATQPTFSGKAPLIATQADSITLRFGNQTPDPLDPQEPLLLASNDDDIQPPQNKDVERLVRFFEESKNSPETKARNEALLRHAAEEGNTQSLLRFIDAGVDVNAQDENGLTALTRASTYRKSISPLQLLISSGAKLDVQDKVNGFNALMFSAYYGNTNHLNLLIAAGANLNLQDEQGNTAVMHAVKRNHLGALKALMDAGADLSIPTKKGETIGMHAVLTDALFNNKALEAIKMVAAAGLDLNIPDNNGETAATLLIKEGYLGALKDLVDAGVKVGLSYKGDKPAAPTTA